MARATPCPCRGPKNERAKNQQIERTLQQLQPFLRLLGGHITQECTGSGKMSTQKQGRLRQRFTDNPRQRGRSVLFFAQRGERIHAGGALCRNVASKKRDASKNS